MKKSIEFFAELLWFISVLAFIFIIVPIIAGVVLGLFI